MHTSELRIPFHNRLGCRIGSIAFVAFFLVDVLLYSAFEGVVLRFTEWGDPDFVRSFADYLEGKPGLDPSQFDFSTSLATSPILLLTTIGYMLLYALVLATIASLLATRRVNRLTKQVAAAAATETGLPAPFHVGGSDEIRFLAAKMNTMRHRIAGLLEEAQERNRLRTEWVSHVSHDLRTPLMALTGVVDRSRALLKLPPEEMALKLPALLDAAEFDTRRIRDLAEDLLEMARLEANADLQLESVPPGELLQSVIRELAPVAESRGIHLESSFPVEAIELKADGRRLIRAVENITLNSLQHADTMVRLSVRHRDSQLEILVEDDGPGLPEQNGQVVLTEIGQDPSRRDSAGIGLEVAQRIIAAHGGEISAENRARGGASVVVSLPLGVKGPLDTALNVH